MYAARPMVDRPIGPSSEKAGIDYRVLFQERSDADAIYPTLEAALDAVKARKKALLVETVRVADLGHEDNEELVRQGLVRGLAVILFNTEPERPRDKQWAYLYIMPLSEVWRIQARNLLLETHKDMNGWNFEVEAFSSRLLGYTSEQTIDWVNRLRREQPSMAALTLFATLTPKQAAVVVQTGCRCLGTPETMETVEIVFVGHGLELRSDAYDRLPASTSLVRFGLRGEFVYKLLGPRIQENFVTVTAHGQQLVEINDALRSRVEILTKHGWE
jgi:hypothetical protein